MVEAGLVILIQGGISAGSPPVTGCPGGFFVELPKDTVSSAVTQAWAYRSINSDPDYVLAGQTGWTEWVVEIACHGYAQADAINLARAIDKVLRGGFQGYLADADHTYVFGVYRRTPMIDGFSDANRTYVRSLEYRFIYQQI